MTLPLCFLSVFFHCHAWAQLAQRQCSTYGAELLRKELATKLLGAPDTCPRSTFQTFQLTECIQGKASSWPPGDH